jgi:alpha-galactosidase
MQDLVFEQDLTGRIELYDTVLEDAQSNASIGNALVSRHKPGHWTFHANPSLEDALSGSDVVFISILPGDFEAMSVDVHAPEAYGIYQSVGDSVGAGGLIRALRTIPQFRLIAQAVEHCAPDAWVINYTNPMSICIRTLYKEFPRIKAAGCCHEVFNTQKLLATVLELAGCAPQGSIAREEIHTRVLGINHFTWIDRASWKHLDILPYYKQFVARYADEGFRGAQAATTFASGSACAEDPEEAARRRFFSGTERVKMDLFRRYGLIAAAGDRHLAEFCPHAWYLASPEQVEAWGYALTPVSWRMANRNTLKALAKAYREGTKTMSPEPSGEEGLAIVKALMGQGTLVSNVNLPNQGQMPDMPRDVVLETNAVFLRDRIQPLAGGELPTDLRALVMHHILAQEGIIEAAFEQDLEKAFRVFSQDLAVQTLSLQDARALFNRMCTQTLKPYRETSRAR